MSFPNNIYLAEKLARSDAFDDSSLRSLVHIVEMLTAEKRKNTFEAKFFSLIFKVKTFKSVPFSKASP